MIIDLILDRKGGVPYNPKKFRFDVNEYGEIGQDIVHALDFLTEEDVQYELCRYVLNHGYRITITDWIRTQRWL